jgi:membrane-associated phospholipid phosphatase
MSPLTSTTRKNRLAWIISEALSPVVLVGILLAAAILAPGGGTILHLLISVVFAALLPYVGLHWATWTGRTTNHWVSNREQRSKVFAWILASILVGLLLLITTHAPVRLFITFGFFLGSLSLAALINRKIKISIHVMVAGALIFGLHPFLGPWAWGALPITAAVAWSRLALGAHKSLEVLLGALAGIFLGGVYGLLV